MDTSMSDDYSILVGTIGNGIWRSVDGGATFQPTPGVNPLDGIVRGFAVDPFDSSHVVCGVGYPHFGLYESTNAGASWGRVTGFPEIEVWRITFDPRSQGRYFAGTRPAGLHVTEDGGESFKQLDAPFAATCPAVGVPRITSITLLPSNPDAMIVTAEVDGVRRSLDGGQTWEVVMDGITTPVPNGAVYGVDGRIDCHHSGASAGDPDLVFVSTPDGLYVSDDIGDTWADFPVPQSFPQQYHREMAIKLDDPNTIFQGTGNWVTGDEGRLQVSRDRGATWTTVDLPDDCNSPIWCFSQHAADPNRIFACTHKGMLFGSADGGHTWRKIRREFSEVRGMAWTPAV
jgi:photosystem II stability/assembly factor-like uncharacterized protein